MILFAKLLGLFPVGWPEPLRKLAAWVSLAVAAIALLAAGWAILKASIIDDHETDKAVASIDARDAAADQRAEDGVRNTINEKESEDAIRSVPAADAQLRLDCLRLQRLGRVPEPCRRFSSDGSQADPQR